MFMNDKELRAALQSTPPLVAGFPGAWDSVPIGDPKWNAVNSPVQPCSIDLHVGEIYIPGTANGRVGSVASGATAHTLLSGHSVVIKSLERISLPTNTGAIALPPSRISSKGIFIANFGHVDPGYEGHMRFTIINMGKEDFVLSKDQDVITLLFFRIADADSSWKSRNPAPRVMSQSEVDVLSKDFGDIDERVKRLTSEALGQSGYRYVIYSFVLPIFGGAIVSAMLYLLTIHLFFQGKLDALEISEHKLSAIHNVLDGRVQKIEKNQEKFDEGRSQERNSIAKRLNELEGRVSVLNGQQVDTKTLRRRIGELEDRLSRSGSGGTQSPPGRQ